ncbi:MAG: sigma-70 family RNA polymerase sigma factor [Ignavibacteriae bacterium]|nr:MAG: sigma-70 family RNA polymerase sigma factor [Ignavibacteriota bacterium]
MALDETELIHQVKQGNENAFEQLVYRYDRTVLSIALKYTGNIDDAKDLYQEVFIRAYRGINNFQFRSEFSTWLYRIAVNVCLSYKSRSKDHLKVSINEDEDDTGFSKDTSEQLVYKGSSPEEETVGNELAEIVDAALETLSSRQKMTFVLKHYEGYKIREIAEMLNCKEGTVKKYLFDAVKNLRKKLSGIYALQS